MARTKKESFKNIFYSYLVAVFCGVLAFICYLKLNVFLYLHVISHELETFISNQDSYLISPYYFFGADLLALGVAVFFSCLFGMTFCFSKIKAAIISFLAYSGSFSLYCYFWEWIPYQHVVTPAYDASMCLISFFLFLFGYSFSGWILKKTIGKRKTIGRLEIDF